MTEMPTWKERVLETVTQERAALQRAIEEREATIARDPRAELPDRFIIDKPGKCEVRCTLVHTTGSYRCREYRC